MDTPIDYSAAVLRAWQTNHRITAFLLENLPSEVWPKELPSAPRRTVRMIAGHIHNCRCMWVKMLSKEIDIEVPVKVDRRLVSPAELLEALEGSNRAIADLLRFAIDHDGRIPAVPWMNFPPDVVHLVTYLASHEGHHRGQIVMVARELGHRLPDAVTNGLWQWTKRAREVSA